MHTIHKRKRLLVSAGRPTDVLALSDGSLLVSDNFAGAVYRISYRD